MKYLVPAPYVGTHGLSQENDLRMQRLENAYGCIGRVKLYKKAKNRTKLVKRPNRTAVFNRAMQHIIYNIEKFGVNSGE